LQNEAVLRHLNGEQPRKVIYVPGKLVNVVV
jgi:leucyl-tRNA synthetase